MRAHGDAVTLSASTPFPSIDRRVDMIGKLGLGTLRYGLVMLLLLWGGAKFTEVEAKAIEPLVSHSPFLSWLYPILGIRGASAVFGVFEVSAALLIAARAWLPRLSGYASLAVSGMFVTTLSFLITTPDVFAPTSPWGGFLMKDIILLGVAPFTASEALRARRCEL
jgi:reactive chlorine resistance protein C